MVAAVRAGASQRSVARQFGVALRTVQVWVARARGQRLDRVDWSDRLRGRRRPVNRIPRATERRVLAIRRELHTHDILGEFGAQAIHRRLAEESIAPLPGVRTIGRILARHGVLDGRRRLRHPAPPPGWHLPAVAEGTTELELFDVIEDLKLADGPLIDVVTGITLHGGFPLAWPVHQATTTQILTCLATHWQRRGLPGYAQFDNDTRFQGAHQHHDVFGRVVRQCLQLGITPVFVPPREFGLQNAIEHFNGLFQSKVWRRFRFPSLAALQRHTIHYLQARRHRLAARIGAAPPRRPWPADWHWQPARLPPGRVIFIRRTTDRGAISLVGSSWMVDPHWTHRLVRAELDLATGTIHCFALRRSAPAEQPLLQVLAYHYPRHDLGR